MIKEKKQEYFKSDEILSDIKDLVLYNDDHNTFDFVIETLIDVCNHTPEQAEQCAYITHYKGKCAVKKGDYIKLKPMKEEINNRGLNSVIE
jgi:ATP-dependent Clp protease adaptor protein ClpS